MKRLLEDRGQLLDGLLNGLIGGDGNGDTATALVTVTATAGAPSATYAKFEG